MDNPREYDYAVDNYLNRVSLSLIGLDRLELCDGKNESFELLSLDVFNDALYALLFAATITGLEEYLRIRLKAEVFRSRETMKKYARLLKGDRKIVIPSVFSKDEISEDDRDTITESLHLHIYHNIDFIAKFYKNLSGFDTQMCPSWSRIQPLITERNRIIHNGKYDNKGSIEVTSYFVHQSLDTVRQFIDEVESAFVKLGSERIIISPDE